MSKWTYNKPTEPGLYWVNSGDVVTVYSLEIQHFSDRGASYLGDSGGIPAISYGDYIKFLKVDIDALNELGNEP